MSGWAKVHTAASYCDVSVRTLRGWLKQGLEHSRLPTGRVLIRYADLDAFLKKFQQPKDEVMNIHKFENKADVIAAEFFGGRRKNINS